MDAGTRAVLKAAIVQLVELKGRSRAAFSNANQEHLNALVAKLNDEEKK